MKKTYQFLFALAAVLFLTANASAVTFEFYDVAAGGEASATIDFSVSGHTLTAIINNTSSTTLIDGTDANAPGITGFGFDLAASGTYSWTMLAYDDSEHLVSIASNDWVVTEDYSFNSSSPSFEFDYVPNTFGGVDGALYNPDAIGSSALPGGSNDVWFTTAVFSITFSELDTYSLLEDVTDALVRMQNVGLDGEGSTKTPGVPVPEPATMLLLGTGLLGLAVTGRKKFKK